MLRIVRGSEILRVAAAVLPPTLAGWRRMVEVGRGELKFVEVDAAAKYWWNSKRGAAGVAVMAPGPGAHAQLTP